MVKREKREMILLPLLYEREGSGLEREVWPGQEVTRRGGAFCQSRRGKEEKKREQKDRCVEIVALEVCSCFEASGKRDLLDRFSFGGFENYSRVLDACSESLLSERTKEAPCWICRERR